MKNVFRHRIIRVLLLITLLTTALTNHYILAQDTVDISDVKFEIVCEDTVGMKGLVHIGYVVDCGNQFNPDFLELKIPKFENDCAKLLYVGKDGTRTSHSIINGKMTTTHKIKWDATLRAITEGSFQTPEVSLLYQNNPLDILPKSKTVVISDNTIHSDRNKQDADTVVKIPDNAIIRLEAVLDKNTINLGDSVLLRVKLQSDQSISQVRFDKPMEIDDCFCENIVTMIVDEPVQTTVNGAKCNEWILYEYLLTPLKSGVIKIPEIKINGNCSIRKDEKDSFWGHLPKYYNVPFQVQSNAIKLKVK